MKWLIISLIFVIIVFIVYKLITKKKFLEIVDSIVDFLTNV